MDLDLSVKTQSFIGSLVRARFMGNEQSSLRSSVAVARLHGHTPTCNLTAPTVLHDMAEILFGTDTLHSLQASKEPHHQALFTELQDELPSSVISESQLASPDVFGKPLNSGPAFRTALLQVSYLTAHGRSFFCNRLSFIALRAVGPTTSRSS